VQRIQIHWEPLAFEPLLGSLGLLSKNKQKRKIINKKQATLETRAKANRYWEGTKWRNDAKFTPSSKLGGGKQYTSWDKKSGSGEERRELLQSDHWPERPTRKKGSHSHHPNRRKVWNRKYRALHKGQSAEAGPRKSVAKLGGKKKRGGHRSGKPEGSKKQESNSTSNTRYLNFRRRGDPGSSAEGF